MTAHSAAAKTGTAVNMAGIAMPDAPSSSNRATDHQSSSSDLSEYWESDLNDDDSVTENDRHRRPSDVTPQMIHEQRLKLMAAPAKNQQEEASSSADSVMETRETLSSKFNPTDGSALDTSITDSTVAQHQPGAFPVTPLVSNSGGPEIAHESEPGADVLKLEAIAVEEGAETRRIQDMEEQLDQEIRARMSLERKIEHSQKPRRCKKEKMPIFVALILIVSGIGVAAYYIFSPATESKNQLEDLVYTFDPPTPEDCQAIENGTEVSNQENMIHDKLDVIFDVSTYSEIKDIQLLLEDFRYKAQNVMIPLVVGCLHYEEILGRPLTEGESSASYFPERYLVGNGIVSNVTQSDAPCKASSPKPCYRIVYNYDFWLKEDSTIVRLIVLVETTVRAELDYILETGDIVKEAVIINILERTD
jgi:hypothetical protein